MKPLSKNPLPTLADEILVILPTLITQMPTGVPVSVLRDALGADAASVRKAIRQLNFDARADMMQRLGSREQFIVPLRHRGVRGLRFCANCGETFVPPPAKKIPGCTYYSNRRCCTRACAIAWSWSRPGVRQRRSAGIKAKCQTPEAKARIAAHNARRWSKPGERERMSEQNKRLWADPVGGALRASAIRERHRRPDARKNRSDSIKARWNDPAGRQKLIDGIRKSKGTAEARAKFSKLLADRWAHPEKRKIYLEGVRKTARKMSERNRGKKQSADQIKKRIESRRRTMAARQAEALA